MAVLDTAIQEVKVAALCREYGRGKCHAHIADCTGHRGRIRGMTMACYRALLFLHEGLFDHKCAGLAVIAFHKAAVLQKRAQIRQHGRAAAEHDPVAFAVEWRCAHIAEKPLRDDKVGNPAPVFERLSRHSWVIDKPFTDRLAHEFIFEQSRSSANRDRRGQLSDGNHERARLFRSGHRFRGRE